MNLNLNLENGKYFINENEYSEGVYNHIKDLYEMYQNVIRYIANIMAGNDTAIFAITSVNDETCEVEISFIQKFGDLNHLKRSMKGIIENINRHLLITI